MLIKLWERCGSQGDKSVCCHALYFVLFPSCSVRMLCCDVWDFLIYSNAKQEGNIACELLAFADLGKISEKVEP